MNLKLAPNFHIKELVPESIFEQFSANEPFLVSLFDNKALITLQALRDQFGSTYVNTWHLGNEIGMHFRGYRPLKCNVGALCSYHKLGMAFDCSFSKVSAEEARQYILKNPQQFPHITAMEGQVSWLHFDVRPADWDGIRVFNP